MSFNPVAWLAKQIAKEIVMTPEIQKAIDDIEATKQLEAAAAAALTLQGTQITALGAQIADLQAQIAAGAGVTAADLAALKAKTDELEQSNTALQAAVPANTSG